MTVSQLIHFLQLEDPTSLGQRADSRPCMFGSGAEDVQSVTREFVTEYLDIHNRISVVVIE